MLKNYKNGAYILILFFSVASSLNQKKLFDYSVQKNIVHGVHIVEYQQWILKIWMKFSEKPSTTSHTVLKLQNKTSNTTELQLDINAFLTINQINGTLLQIEQITEFSNDLVDQFFQHTTRTQNWQFLMLSYQNEYLSIQTRSTKHIIQTYDYSNLNNGVIDFKNNNTEYQVVFANAQITEIKSEIEQIQQLFNEQKMIGFYFFPFLSKNRLFVENVSNPEENPLYLEEFYQTPSDLFETYKTHNIFSSVKINFPVFWNSYAFYSMKMSLSFSLVAKMNMQTTIQSIKNNIILYHRDVKFSELNTTNFFETVLNLNTDVQSSIDQINPENTTFNQTLQIDMSYSEDGIIVQNNMWNATYFLSQTNRIVNIIYFQHLKAFYEQQSQNINKFFYFINNAISQQTNSSIIFSKQDQHYCSFSTYDVDLNFYYDFMIQEIIFYQDLSENENYFFLDGSQNVSLYCQLDDTLPFFQERFLINNNDILTLKNCQRLPFFQRCDAFQNCVRCQKNKCIQCANNHYLYNNSCLECFYPFVVIDNNCLYPNRVFTSKLEAYQTTQMINALGSAKTSKSLQSYVFVSLKNPNNEIYLKTEYLFLSLNGIFGGQDHQNNLLSFFSFSILQYDIRFEVSLLMYDLDVLNLNNFSTFRCTQNFQHIFGQHIKCVLDCQDGYYLSGKFCIKNTDGCKTQIQSSNLECSECKNGFEIFFSQQYNINNCIVADVSQSAFLKYDNSQIYSSQTYQNLTYIYNSIQYPICNILLNQFLQDLDCINKNVEQANICDFVDQNGKCDAQNVTQITPGYLLGQDNILFNYFSQNYLDWKNLTCQSFVTFDSIQQNISSLNGLCFWNADLSNNARQFYSCKLIDTQCQQCDVANTNLCTLCSAGQLIQFSFHSECGMPLPNCIVHFRFQGNLYCEKCETGYIMVATDNTQQTFGLCVQNLIADCSYYVLNQQNVVECSQNVFCEAGYISTNLDSPQCVLMQQHVDYCSQYIKNLQDLYQCTQCTENYKCLQINGIIKETNDNFEPCKICLIDFVIIEGCYIYDEQGNCIQCYSTHYLSNQNLCLSNCIKFDVNDPSLCIDCYIENFLQNQTCYQKIEYCETLNNIGCEICIDGAFKYIDQNYFYKCKVILENCLIISSVDPKNCVQCEEGFRLFQDFNSIQVCTIEIQNCLYYFDQDSYRCDQCNQNYRIITQQFLYDICEPEILNCLNYQKDNPYICNECQQSYYLSLDQLQCIRINDSIPYLSQYSQYVWKLTNQEQFEIQTCLLTIENCEICYQNYCFQCKQGYFLSENSCKQNCVQKNKLCIQCNQIDQSQCDKCQYQSVMYQHECQDPCKNYILLQQCYQNLCFHNNPNCQQCKQHNPFLCQSCTRGFNLDTENSCKGQHNSSLFNFVQIYDQCQNYCLICESLQCQYCMYSFKIQYTQCIKSEMNSLLDQIEKFAVCLKEVICFYKNQPVNQNCPQCKNNCSILVKNSFNTFQLYSVSQLQFNERVSINESLFEIKILQKNKLQIQIINFSKKRYQLSFNRNRLFSFSINCTPQQIYNFNLENEFYSIRHLMSQRSKIQQAVQAFVFGPLQFLLPGNFVLHLLSYIQKLELLSYLSYIELNGGWLFSLTNSIPEYETSIISFVQNNSKDFQRQFMLLQFQQTFFDLLYYGLFQVLIFFSLTIFLISFRQIFQNIRTNFKNKIKNLFEHYETAFQKFFCTFIGILQIYYLPKIGRFFLMSHCINKKQAIKLYFNDTLICYLVVYNFYRYFNLKCYKNKTKRRHLSIFSKDRFRLFKFEYILNHWIAIDQVLCLIRAYIFYIYQNNSFFAIILVFFISVFYSFYYIIKIKYFKGPIRIIICSYIVVEFMLIFYFIQIITASFYKDYNIFKLSLDATFLTLNILKMFESILFIKVSRKIEKNSLSHFDIINNDNFIISKTTQFYQFEFTEMQVDSEKIFNEEELENKLKQSQLDLRVRQSYMNSLTKRAEYFSYNQINPNNFFRLRQNMEKYDVFQ